MELDAQLTARRDEIAALSDELRAAVRQKRVLDLPPKIERLLVLKPDHAYAKRLAGQVQGHVADAAKKHLAEHRYDQALHALGQIAPHVRTESVQQLHHRVSELAWLTYDLRHAPVADATLVAVAERLRRLAPDDPRAAKLLAELQRRVRAAEGKSAQKPLPWARPPQPSALGTPANWLTDLPNLRYAETMDQSDLQRNPGRFAVACGLALAGIKQAPLRINLVSAEKLSALHQVKRLMKTPIGRTRHAWGIDLGASGLKAVRLTWEESQPQPVIDAAVLVEHPKLLSQAANDAEERRLVADTLKTFLDSHEIKAERVCVGLSGRLALVRRVPLPPIKPAKVRKFVQLEGRHLFPLPLDELSWDFQAVDDAPTIPAGAAASPAQPTRQALLIAVKRSSSRRFLETFERLGVNVKVLQPDFVALHNFLAHVQVTSPSGEPPAVAAALDVGATTTNIVVSSPGSLWFHSCGVAGHSFTRAW